MKNDIVMYEKIYQILKYKIESGLLSDGSKLPSRANLCKEFNTSEKTIRRAVNLLIENGLVESTQRKRPTITYKKYNTNQNKNQSMLKKADAIKANDILNTGILLCNPLNARGISLCKGNDWSIPEEILNNMDPNRPLEFWRLSNKLWHFFISRNENDLIIRVIESLGFSGIDPLPGTYQQRLKYLKDLELLFDTAKIHGDLESIDFDDLSILYGFIPDCKEDVPTYQVMPDSPLRIGVRKLEQKISKGEERYSSVYMDLLGLIAVGHYQLGQRLPSIIELHQIYDVSVETVSKAIQILQNWGVVNSVRGKGIFITMDLDNLKKIPLDPKLLACHVRRFLDSLEFLSITIEGVSKHIAKYSKPHEVQELYKKLEENWHKHYLYQLSPRTILDFIVEHIQYDALKTIYKIIKKNYQIGRSIPKLVNPTKTPVNFKIHCLCIEAVELLLTQNIELFAKKVTEMFQYVHQLVILECQKLNYFQPAMEVYDGSMLWK